MAKQEWPAWRYGPNEQARIFNKDDVVPKGWADHPSKLKAPVQDLIEPEPTQEERRATIASIREAGAEIGDNATDDEINAAIDKLQGS